MYQSQPQKMQEYRQQRNQSQQQERQRNEQQRQQKQRLDKEVSEIFDDLCRFSLHFPLSFPGSSPLIPLFGPALSRFLLNIPPEEAALDRIVFQIERAHWFYLDNFCAKNPELAKYALRTFSSIMFKHCPTLRRHAKSADDIFMAFTQYKAMIPVCGGILLNATLDKCLLVRAQNAGTIQWGFPRGKMDQGEREIDCAVREVWEEVGYRVEDKITENDYFERMKGGHLLRLYVIPGVPESTHFQTQTIGEIGVRVPPHLCWFLSGHQCHLNLSSVGHQLALH